MALEQFAKLTIIPRPPSKLKEKFPKGIEVLFNPNSYTITNSVNWSPPQSPTTGQAETIRELNAPTLSYGGGSNRQITFELFFDVTERPDIDDVRKETDKIFELTRIERDNKGRPPECDLFWGTALAAPYQFIGVVSNLTQRFTLFKSDGKPVRATLTVVFTEVLDPEKDKRQTDPELTTRVVKRGDTLSSIAAEMYHDPKLWRLIAEANRLDNPRRLEVGRRLTIPKLR